MSDSAPVGKVEPASRVDDGFVSRFIGLFRPDPPAAVRITDPAEITASYRRYRTQILIATMVGYAAYYFVRKNIGIAMPVMEKEIGINKSDLGLFLTLHGVIYGLSKFANGFLGDRCNGRMFMVTGLVICALLNVWFGFSGTVLLMGIVWMLNGWFQGMGFPPCARSLTHWYPPQVLATRMSVWNTSHSIGAGLTVLLCGYVVAYGWQFVFWAPAIIALLCAAFLWMTMKDTPESVGLPEVEGTHAPAVQSGDAGAGTPIAPAQESSYWMKRVFRSPYIWLFALANFFVYTVRYAVFDWSPSMLTQARAFSLEDAGRVTAGFEFAGIVGMLSSGWITDRVFGGRGGRTCLFYMAACSAVIFVFWKFPTHDVFRTAILMALAGFFIYGPQALVGIAVANLATKHAAATAVGLTGIFGYLSTVVSGWGFGTLVKHYGWELGFKGMFGFSLIGAILFSLVWFAPSHGYGDAGSKK